MLSGVRPGSLCFLIVSNGREMPEEPEGAAAAKLGVLTSLSIAD